MLMSTITNGGIFLHIKIKNETKINKDKLYFAVKCYVRVIFLWIRIWKTNSDKVFSNTKKKSKKKSSNAFFKALFKNSELVFGKAYGSIGMATAKNSVMLCSVLNSLSNKSFVLNLTPTYAGINFDMHIICVLKVNAWKIIKALLRGIGDKKDGFKKHK